MWHADCFSVLRMVEPLVDRLGHYLNLLGTRQKLVSSNIANADTPDYRTRDIDFQFEFMSLTRGGQPHVVNPEGLAVKSDGNDVNMDREARLLAENAMRFQLASALLKNQFRQVHSAIEGGRGL